ncbi:MAG: formate dehydrogenase accessory sulfurtransferase FdhD [Fulvivirga sp.]|uniref:formate dehydrogenase accessory sulfurtransferase FdhD n=1 Tax=Fulvivirga sp. TaxID=1931237 RepID=UPI00330117B4
MVNTTVGATEVIKVSGKQRNQQPDLLAVEEPLEIRLNYGPLESRQEKAIAVTMRTPGHDHELALGFLSTEGIVKLKGEIVSISHCESVKEEERGNVVKVALHPEVDFDIKQLERHFYTNSSCGVCGKASIESVETGCKVILNKDVFAEKVIHNAPDKLRAAQKVFEYTGGLHAAGFFNLMGELEMMREDVGRHNALDKLIGAGIEMEKDLSHGFVLVSGRASFELIQKAAMASIPVLAAVGAPSSLAVDLAKKMNMTLLGFVRNNSFNIYCGVQRVQSS